MSDDVPEFKPEPADKTNNELYQFHLSEAERLSGEAVKRFQNSQKKAFLTRADSEVQIAIYLQSSASYHMERAKLYLNEVEHEHRHEENSHPHVHNVDSSVAETPVTPVAEA